jgi:hypothetical protein
VFVRMVEGDLVEQQEPFDCSSTMLDRHAAVVAQQVSNLRVQAFQA